MSDHIDRQAAIEAMSRISDSICEAEAVDALCEVPTIELIRCKDCKYGERLAPDKCYCNGFLNAWVDEDDFCAWAEPKEADG